ncbi:hypothetical protein ACIA98_32565 [Streptomyces sp. NPDC051366]
MAGFATVGAWDFCPQMANPKRLWANVYVIATQWTKKRRLEMSW